MTEGRRIERHSPAPPVRQTQIPRAMMLMVGATLVFAASSAMSKWLVGIYPVTEVLFLRTIVGLAVLGLFILPTTGLAVYRTRKLGAHIMRGVSQTTAQLLLLLAFSMLPLASATAINFSAPLFATLASAVFLKETVGGARWATLLVGFLGVLIVTNPDAGTFQIGTLYALGNAILFGTVTAGVRGMTNTESADTLAMYQMTIITFFYALTLPFAFITPNWHDFGLMLVNGLTNAIGQYWWTCALHLAPTSAVAPLQYLSLVWVMILGFAIWGDVPTASLVIGSAIVCGSGIFLFWRESRRSRAPAVAE